MRPAMPSWRMMERWRAWRYVWSFFLWVAGGGERVGHGYNGVPFIAPRQYTDTRGAFGWFSSFSCGPGEQKMEASFFLRPAAISGHHHLAPTTHPPTYPPTHVGGTTTVQQCVPTNPQRQHTGRSAAGWDGDFHFFSILRFPG